MATANFFWQAENTPSELHELLKTIGESYTVSEGSGSGISLKFEKLANSGELRTELTGNEAYIGYGSVNMAARGLGTVLSGIKATRETMPFESFGIMLDCSRNAVMTVSHFKKWLRELALLGYNQAMLYTEDTYELPGEPYFGYLRGRYTREELKEIDDYAAKLGIEMIGCIQTLGHLAQILKWSAYNEIRDTAGVMMAGEPKTYALIEKMLDLFASVFRSRRIHVGMDETHDLGRGRYMDLNGYERGFDIFNNHLAKVVELCKSRGLQPMIWSDMYFRMGSKDMDYYDKECVIPEDVKNKIPSKAQLVYWDYYHDNEEFYLDWIERHRQLGFEPLMGSGVWTWGLLWYFHQKTKKTVDPCIEACRKAGLKELFFTMWGDDGAYCEFDSAIAGLCYSAERACHSEPDEEIISKRFENICGGNYQANLTVSGINDLNNAPALLWDDPLLGIFWKDEQCKDAEIWNKCASNLAGISNFLSKTEFESNAGDLSHANNLLKLLAKKISIRQKLEKAYSERDTKQLGSVITDDIPEIIKLVGAFQDSFRSQWIRRNKAFGLEVIQIRLAGQIERYKELARRLNELLENKITSIPEFEENAEGRGIGAGYNTLATGSTNI
jgi:hypothetical protein